MSAVPPVTNPPGGEATPPPGGANPPAPGGPATTPPNTPPPGEGAGAGGNNQDGEPKTIEEAKALAEKFKKDKSDANAEAARLRAENKALKDAEEARNREKMSDIEKAQADAKKAADDLAAEKLVNLNLKIENAAARLGFADPADAVGLIDRTKLDKDNSNVDTLLKAVLEAKPYLKGQPQKGGTPPGNPPQGGGSGDNKEQMVQAYPSLKGRV